MMTLNKIGKRRAKGLGIWSLVVNAEFQHFIEKCHLSWKICGSGAQTGEQSSRYRDLMASVFPDSGSCSCNFGWDSPEWVGRLC